MLGLSVLLRGADTSNICESHGLFPSNNGDLKKFRNMGQLLIREHIFFKHW